MLLDDFGVVTAIYNLKRGEIDGRGINQYKIWLSKTLQVFPKAIVFCEDPTLSGEFGGLGTWVNLPISEFHFSSQLAEISKICLELKKYSNDVTFSLPMYAVFQIAKFQLLSHALSLSSLPKYKGYLWVDAGISRFVFEPSNRHKSKKVRSIRFGNESLFEIDFKKNLTWNGELKFSQPGTNRRSFSGTSFYLTKDDIIIYDKAIVNAAQNWIDIGLWDNEQVLLNNLFKSKIISPGLIRQKNETGSVARSFLGQESFFLLTQNNPIYKILQH